MCCHVRLPHCPQSPWEEAHRLVYLSLRRGPFIFLPVIFLHGRKKKGVVAAFACNLFLHPRKFFQDKWHAWYMVPQRDTGGSKVVTILDFFFWCTHCPRLVHAGYRCPHDNCQVLEHTWGKLRKHMAKHPGKYVVVIVQNCWNLSQFFFKSDFVFHFKNVS